MRARSRRVYERTHTRTHERASERGEARSPPRVRSRALRQPSPLPSLSRPSHLRLGGRRLSSSSDGRLGVLQRGVERILRAAERGHIGLRRLQRLRQQGLHRARRARDAPRERRRGAARVVAPPARAPQRERRLRSDGIDAREPHSARRARCAREAARRATPPAGARLRRARRRHGDRPGAVANGGGGSASGGTGAAPRLAQRRRPAHQQDVLLQQETRRQAVDAADLCDRSGGRAGRACACACRSASAGARLCRGARAVACARRCWRRGVRRRTPGGAERASSCAGTNAGGRLGRRRLGLRDSGRCRLSRRCPGVCGDAGAGEGRAAARGLDGGRGPAHGLTVLLQCGEGRHAVGEAAPASAPARRHGAAERARAGAGASDSRSSARWRRGASAGGLPADGAGRHRQVRSLLGHARGSSERSAAAGGARARVRCRDARTRGTGSSRPAARRCNSRVRLGARLTCASRYAQLRDHGCHTGGGARSRARGGAAWKARAQPRSAQVDAGAAEQEPEGVRALRCAVGRAERALLERGPSERAGERASERRPAAARRPPWTTDPFVAFAAVAAMAEAEAATARTKSIRWIPPLTRCVRARPARPSCVARVSLRAHAGWPAASSPAHPPGRAPLTACACAGRAERRLGHRNRARAGRQAAQRRLGAGGTPVRAGRRRS